MIDGIAASSSIAVASGRRSHAGASSVRNIAMPKEIGTATTIAIIDVTSVPTIGISAPNCSLTGSQTGLTMNAGPNALIAGQLPMKSDTRIAASRLNTRSAKNCVVR